MRPLTANPIINVAYEGDHVYHTRKMRTKTEFHAPGGATGYALDGLLDRHQRMRNRIPDQSSPNGA